jgi:hypothetical protein
MTPDPREALGRLQTLFTRRRDWMQRESFLVEADIYERARAAVETELSRLNPPTPPAGEEGRHV